MALPVPRMTLEAFLTLPEEAPALELIDGVVIQKVSPQAKHALLQYRFTDRVNEFAEPRELALALPEIRGVYGPDSLVPDVGVFRWARIPADVYGNIDDVLNTLPDIAVEISSPGQSLGNQLAKCRRYIDRGVPIVLHLDPRTATVTRFAQNEVERVLTGDDRIDLDTVLPNFELTVSELFDSMRIRR